MVPPFKLLRPKTHRSLLKEVESNGPVKYAARPLIAWAGAGSFGRMIKGRIMGGKA